MYAEVGEMPAEVAPIVTQQLMDTKVNLSVTQGS